MRVEGYLSDSLWQTRSVLVASSFFNFEETFQRTVPCSSSSLEGVAELIRCSERSSIQRRRLDGREADASLDKANLGTLVAYAKLIIR